MTFYPPRNGQCSELIFRGGMLVYHNKPATATVTYLNGRTKELCTLHANLAVKSAREPGMITAKFHPVESKLRSE